MKKLRQFLFPIICCVLLLVACSDDDCNDPRNESCSNFDPCLLKKPVSADFTIHETFQLRRDYWKPYDTDTVNTYEVIFTAKEAGAEYEWTLGAETIYERSFSRNEFPLKSNIDIQLIVTKTPDHSCFPDDDGVDTLKRTFHIAEPLFGNSKVSGQFIGRDSGDINTEDRVVEFDPTYHYPNPNDRTFLRIINLVPGCDLYGFNTTLFGYRQIAFGAHGSVECLNPTGRAKVFGLKNDSIRIDYKIDRAPNVFDNPIQKVFIGVRKK